MKNGKHVFFRCGDCNFLHLGKVSICSKCHSSNILEETFDEIPLDRFEMFSDHEKISAPGACCAICHASSEEKGIDFYSIEDRPAINKGHIYCPEHYIKMKWLMITYGLNLHDAEANIALSERRKFY